MENGGLKKRHRRSYDCSWTAKISFIFFFLAYVSLGAYVFMLMESSSQFNPPTEEIRTPLSETSANNTTQLKELMTRQVLDKLWEITENLNILYKDNWTRLAAEEIHHFHDTMHLWMKKDCDGKGTDTDHRHNKIVKWNYPTAFLYALSVITTLGSCPVTPESNEGKMLTIVFAAFGIPLLLFYLTVVGSALSSCFMCCPLLDWRKQQRLSSSTGQRPAVVTTLRDPSSFSHHPPAGNELLFSMKSSVDDEATSSTSSSSDYNRLIGRMRSFWVPFFCLVLLLFFVTCGTFLFSFLMSLSVTDALLLSFMLLTTTGIPDAHSSVWSGHSSWPLVAVSIYIFLALTLCSICFNLMYEWLLSQWVTSDPSESERRS